MDPLPSLKFAIYITHFPKVPLLDVGGPQTHIIAPTHPYGFSGSATDGNNTHNLFTVIWCGTYDKGTVR